MPTWACDGLRYFANRTRWVGFELVNNPSLATSIVRSCRFTFITSLTVIIKECGTVWIVCVCVYFCVCKHCVCVFLCAWGGWCVRSSCVDGSGQKTVRRNKIGPGQAWIPASELCPALKYLSIFNSVFCWVHQLVLQKNRHPHFPAPPFSVTYIFLGKIAWACHISWGA